MKHSIIACVAALGLWAIPARAVEYVDWVDWDQIQHWAGDPDGEHKCALVIDFQDGQSEQSCVWGYRWNGTKTGEDLVRAVASQSSILTAMIQYTGTMGSTLNALGISANREELDYLQYDFDRAAIGGEVSFDYFTPNTSMGQDVAPGYDTPEMCQAAIERARTTGIIEHPLNAFFYGYAAYDYDYWQLEDGYKDMYEYRWRSGWYDGYWSYWHGPNDYDYMSYSGLGMSSTVLVDGGVQAWKYVVFNGGGYGDTGGELAMDLNYDMSDWGEAMHEAAEPVQPIDQANVDCWVGEGEKAATVVFQFNDGKGPENLVYGYRWTGGWDDNLKTVVETIAKADPRMKLATESGRFTLTYDSDHDGALGNRDHTDVSDTWNCYVKRVVDDTYHKVPSGRWLNPNAVMIFSHQPAETAEVSLPYQLFRPAFASEQIITIPKVMDYALADRNIQIPLFIQLPQAGGKVNTAFNFSTKPGIVGASSVTNLMGTVTAYKNFTPTTGDIVIRGSYVPSGETKANYVTSNTASVTFRNPERPITTMHYENASVDVRLNHAVDNALVFEPTDATYTKMKYTSSNRTAATVSATDGTISTTRTAGKSTITATYDFDSSIAATCDINSSLQQAVTDVTFEGADEDGVITLTPKQMTGLFPIFTPEDPDIADVSCTLSGNGSSMSDYIATMYTVNLWDENNKMFRRPELSGHRVGQCELIVKSQDGSGFEKTFTVNVVDPERETPIDYTTGTIMLNEEWFGHTNGGLNWYSPDYDVVYQAYERENPGMSFGCTSQYGLIYDGKLIVSSKQASDGGDPLPGGGRLVVADATTLKRLGSIDDIMIDGDTRSGDGRALCGAGPGRVYMGTHSGIYIIDINECKILGKVGSELIDSDDDGKPNTDPSGSLYSAQIGDMTLAGHYVFALRQGYGVYVIDIDNDKVVKFIDDKQVQGITQSADGRVWYATLTADEKGSIFVALDHNTLEENTRVDVPAEYGAVTCGWGAWRTTQFTGAHSVNSLFFCPGSSISNGGGGVIYRYDIDDNQFSHIATVSGLPAHTPGQKQGAYGTIRYDDRTGEIIAGTTEFKASGHYRYNWTHFIDAQTGEFKRTVELRPYYWFQSHPIFPDVYGPEMEEIDDITLMVGEAPREIEINATDRDNNDANIHYSLVAAPAVTADETSPATPVEVSLTGNKLTLKPLAEGQHSFGIAVESNGRVVRHAVNVNVQTVTGIDEIASSSRSISCLGHTLTLRGCAGETCDIVNALGVTVDSFVIGSDDFTHVTTVPNGVYIIVCNNGYSKKIIVK